MTASGISAEAATGCNTMQHIATQCNTHIECNTYPPAHVTHAKAKTGPIAPKLQTPNAKPCTPNPKTRACCTQTPNAKRQTIHPKPYTSKPNRSTQGVSKTKGLNPKLSSVENKSQFLFSSGIVTSAPRPKVSCCWLARRREESLGAAVFCAPDLGATQPRHPQKSGAHARVWMISSASLVSPFCPAPICCVRCVAVCCVLRCV